MERILVVEDDPAIALGLRKNLKYEGYDVICATKGDEGLEKALEKIAEHAFPL